MHDHSCFWEVKPLHNNNGIFSKYFLKKSHSFLNFVKVKLKIKMHAFVIMFEMFQGTSIHV